MTVTNYDAIAAKMGNMIVLNSAETLSLDISFLSQFRRWLAVRQLIYTSESGLAQRICYVLAEFP